MNRAASRSPTVLIVDDEPMIRQVISCFLRSRDLTAVEAANGTEALQLTRTEGLRPQLVILDVVMPGMSGVMLLHELRQDDPVLPALLVSGFCDDQDGVEQTMDERTRFLGKPFNFKVLETEINRLLPQKIQAG